MSQKRQIVINVGSNLEFVNLYECDNHLDLYKNIVKTLKNFKNRCNKDGRRNSQVVQNQ